MNTMGQVVSDDFIGTAQHFHITLNSLDGIFYMEVKTLNSAPLILKVIKK